MSDQTNPDHTLEKTTVVVVWLATALVSLLERDGQSLALLHEAGLTSPLLISALIWGGSGVDAGLGLALWLRPGRAVYWSALIAMLVMTVLATALLPALWLHPLGPLLKNLPIAAILWRLARSQP